MSNKLNFTPQEADLWFDRNFAKKNDYSPLIENDAIINLFKNGDLTIPNTLLEIGCSNGWRLNALKQMGVTSCYGTDISEKAIQSGMAQFKNLNLTVAPATKIPHAAISLDAVIAGFFLYVCNREDLFTICAEIDRVLKVGGHLLIYDFVPDRVYRKPYSHSPGSFSYKMDYSSLFKSNPQYKEVTRKEFDHGNLNQFARTADDNVGVVVLKKISADEAFPLA